MTEKLHRTHVNHGFIPFLGAGCSLSEWDPKSREIALGRLELIGARVDSEAVQEEINSLAREKKLISRDESLDFSDEEDPQELGMSEERLAFQVALMELYEDAWSQSKGLLPDVPPTSKRTGPTVELNDESSRELSKLIEEVIEHLDDWGAVPSEPDLPDTRGEGGADVERPELPTESIHGYLDALDAKVNPTGRDDGELDWETVTWIGRTFWCSVRYDIPHHPSSSDLATQLGMRREVQKSLEEPQPIELQEAAELLETAPEGETAHQATMLEAITDTFLWYESRRRTQPRIHETLAEYLTDPEGPQVAFTTNFDCNLERALLEKRTEFRVTFPMNTDEEEGRWAYYYYIPRLADGLDDPHYVDDFGPFERFSSYGEGPAHTSGPLIVKLHGTRVLTDSIGDSVNYEMGDHDPTKPLLVVSERSYLETLRPGLPYWIKREAGLSDRDSDKGTAVARDGGVRASSSHEARESAPSGGGDSAGDGDATQIVFLGYSVGDWNVRLQFSNIRKQAPAYGNRTVVDIKFDPIARKFLSNIDFQARKVEKLDEFCELLEAEME